MAENEAQIHWDVALGEALSDARTLVDNANDLYRAACDTEREIVKAAQYRFSEEVSYTDLSRAGGDTKREVHENVSKISTDLQRLREDIEEVGEVGMRQIYSIQTRH